MNGDSRIASERKPAVLANSSLSPEPEPFDRDFSYGFYLRLLAACAQRFAIHPLRNFAPPRDDAPRLYLRHDIDVAVEPAVALAEQEAAHGFQSTYMFIATSPLYDLADEQVQEALKRIAGLGHELALHFDYLTSEVADPSNAENLESRVEQQCDRLANITGSPVESISFHRPIKQFLHGPDWLWGRVNAYSATLMQFYRSDSAGHWRSGNPIGDVPRAGVATAQLLTHPIWWEEQHLAPADRLEHFFETRAEGKTADQRKDFDDLLLETLPGIRRSGLQPN